MSKKSLFELNYVLLERMIIPPKGDIIFSYLVIKTDKPYNNYEALEEWVSKISNDFNGWELVSSSYENPNM